MRRAPITLILAALTGCASMMHKPDVTITSAELQETGTCAINVVEEVSIFDPVVLKACAKGPADLSVLFGTMHNETATPSNWRVRVWGPDGKLLLDADNLTGSPNIGQCGTGGCSKEALSTFKLPQPWGRGIYTIECNSKLPPSLKVLFHFTMT